MRPIFLLVLAAAALSAPPAAADEKAVCFDAASKAQSLRDAHRLLEARQQLRVCTRSVCPALVQRDCSSWLEAVEQGLPTVVVTAKDDQGHDLLDVKVTVDGSTFAVRLTGTALPIDPGSHSVHFESPDGLGADRTILVKEGAKNQEVSAILTKAGSGPPPPPPPPPAPVTPAAEPENQAVPTPASPAAQDAPVTSPWRTVGWIAGAVGLVGGGFGAYFGVQAINSKDAAHCDPSNACLHGPLADARSFATYATISTIAGGALLAGGTVLVVAFPSRDGPAQPAALRFGPTIGAQHAGVALDGSW